MNKNDIHNILYSKKTSNPLIFFYSNIIESANNDYIYDIQDFLGDYNLDGAFYAVYLKKICLLDKKNIIANKILNIHINYLYLYTKIYFSEVNNNITIEFNITGLPSYSISLKVKKDFKIYNTYNKNSLDDICFIDNIYHLSENIAKNMNNMIIKNNNIIKLFMVIYYSNYENIFNKNDISIYEISKISANNPEDKSLFPIVQLIFNKSLYDALPEHFINEKKEFFLFNGFMRREKNIKENKLGKKQYKILNSILEYKNQIPG